MRLTNDGKPDIIVVGFINLWGENPPYNVQRESSIEENKKSNCKAVDNIIKKLEVNWYEEK